MNVPKRPVIVTTDVAVYGAAGTTFVTAIDRDTITLAIGKYREPLTIRRSSIRRVSFHR